MKLATNPGEECQSELKSIECIHSSLNQNLKTGSIIQPHAKIKSTLRTLLNWSA